ncbi:Neutral ceramidase [Armadillidium vulgare]|nr:Neutral ceramidase [Armadillidium vulgare]
MENSTCNGRSQLCYASGPGKDMMENTKNYWRRQFKKAWELYHNASSAIKLTGPVQHRMQYIDMANFTFQHPNGTNVTTCPPALGYSFAAGTTDGPGAFDFKQGAKIPNGFWKYIPAFLGDPKPDVKACHAPKPIFLNTGSYDFPYTWHPRIIDTQMGRVGKFFIIAASGEYTTMAGRRLKNKIVQKASDHGLHDSIAIIAGLSNVYSHYITTFQEYQVQRYEGASTLFGPNTHEAYMYQYAYLLESMAKGTILDKGPPPPDLYDKQLSFLPLHLFDSPYNMKNFGDVITQPQSIAHNGETQVAVFVGGNPRNNLRLGGTFITVERKMNETHWKIVATDSSWETRIKHFGNWKRILTGTIEEYEGVSQEFTVTGIAGGQGMSEGGYKEPIHS